MSTFSGSWAEATGYPLWKCFLPAQVTSADWAQHICPLTPTPREVFPGQPMTLSPPSFLWDSLGNGVTFPVTGEVSVELART